MPEQCQPLPELTRLTLLLLVLERVHLVDPWPVVGRVSAESNVERLQELVHTGQQTLGWPRVGLDTWLAIVHDYTVGEVSSHDLPSAMHLQMRRTKSCSTTNAVRLACRM